MRIQNPRPVTRTAHARLGRSLPLLVLGVLVLAMAQACVYNPADGDFVRSREVRFEGFASKPGGRIRIEAMLPMVGYRDVVSDIVASTAAHPLSGDVELYRWTRTEAIPERFWWGQYDYTIETGERHTESVKLRIHEDAGRYSPLPTFTDAGALCLGEHVLDGTSYSEAGATCMTGHDLTLYHNLDTIVIPVQVHVLTSRGGELPTWRFDRAELEAHLGRIFDPSVPDLFNFEEKELLRPDPAWHEAGIQFYLEDVDFIPTSSLHRTLLSQDELNSMSRYTKPCDSSQVRSLWQDRHREEPGVHVYLGGEIGALDYETRHVSGLTCALDVPNRPGASCEDVNSGTDSYILVDARDFPYDKYERPAVLAHELGHFVGLAHTEDLVSCGADLVGSGDESNLMGAGTYMADGSLTELQIDRARDVACQWLAKWGVRAPSCR